jgi:cation:H+ antiporter
MAGGVLQFILWGGLVLAGIAMMQAGAERACALLSTLRTRWGFPATVGGVFVGLATASPEISVNLASVAFGWPDLGLGAALGSNVPALPLVFAIAYLATRFPGREDTALKQAPPPRVRPEAVNVQVLPYLGVVLLLGFLTLPPPWAGLQPVDGLILAVAYGGYVAHALARAKRGDRAALPGGIWKRLLIAVPLIAAGALASVIGSRHLVDLLGISDLVGGLFIIGLLCALPESFAAWKLAREGKATTALSGAVADGIVSLTLALVPPALIGAAVGNTALYLINLSFLAGVLALYIGFNHFSRGQEMGASRVSLLGAGYAVYLVATLVVLNG